jgi:hypothetical protein
MGGYGSVGEGSGECLLEDLDALPATGRVAIFVLGPSARVRDTNRLDRHGERGFAVVCQTTRPFNGSIRKARVTTGPDTEAQVHGRLWEIFASVRVGVQQCADYVAVDVPLQLLSRPVEGVVVECFLWCLNWIVDRAVIARCVSLAEIVGLYIAVVPTHKLPVYLVEIIGLKDHGRDDTLAGRRLHDDLDLAEEEVEVCLYGGGVETLIYGEFGAVAAVVDRAGGGIPDTARHGRGGEVDAVVCDTEGDVGGAGGGIERVAGGPCLGMDEGGKEG